MSDDRITRRQALARTAAGALVLCGSGCPSPTERRPDEPPDAAAQAVRPTWIDRPPVEPDAWYGVGEGADVKAAFAAAVVEIAAQSDARVSTRISRTTTEQSTTDAITGRLDRAFADDFETRVRIDSEAAVPGVRVEKRWIGPAGRIWVLARAPQSQILETLQGAIDTLLRQWRPADGARVVVLPPVDILGRATSLSAYLLGGLLQHLRAVRPGLDLFAPARLADAGGLERVLARPPSAALLHGEVDDTGERLSVEFKVMSAPGLDSMLGVARLELPRRGEVAVMHGRVRQHLHGVVKPLMMGLAAGGAQVSLGISERSPLPRALVRITVQSDRDGYLTLFDIDPEGHVTRLVPWQPDRPYPVRAHARLTVPDDVPDLAGKAIQAYASPVPGPERIMAIVSPDPLPELAEAFTLALPDLTPDAHARQIETVSRVRALLARTPDAGVARLSYFVRRP